MTPSRLPEVLVIEPAVFGDERGFFLESYNQRDFQRETGLSPVFVQDNHSRSAKGVLRGMHYQIRQPQGKLVRVVRGAAFDVAVDLRRSSPRFGQWMAIALNERNKRQLWSPEGFAHGFLALADDTEFLYKATDYYAPEHERCLAWNDPSLGIDWPLEGLGEPLISGKDRLGAALRDTETFDW